MRCVMYRDPMTVTDSGRMSSAELQQASTGSDISALATTAGNEKGELSPKLHNTSFPDYEMDRRQLEKRDSSLSSAESRRRQGLRDEGRHPVGSKHGN